MMNLKVCSIDLIVSIIFSLVLTSEGGIIVVYSGQDEREISLSDTCCSGFYKLVNILS
ncbi:unnamed protein product [Coffea canephora]|uniref:Uncharacterized protein n=1 Tax=Coffea canephora TaxID=49390 RepID=A0A068URI6_COFCA|nr:unnamed protein product [Coffea canephora]